MTAPPSSSFEASVLLFTINYTQKTEELRLFFVYRNKTNSLVIDNKKISSKVYIPTADIASISTGGEQGRFQRTPRRGNNSNLQPGGEALGVCVRSLWLTLALATQEAQEV